MSPHCTWYVSPAFHFLNDFSSRRASGLEIFQREIQRITIGNSQS